MEFLIIFNAFTEISNYVMEKFFFLYNEFCSFFGRVYTTAHCNTTGRMYEGACGGPARPSQIYQKEFPQPP
jgi:hypothetical protein